MSFTAIKFQKRPVCCFIQIIIILGARNRARVDAGRLPLTLVDAFSDVDRAAVTFDSPTSAEPLVKFDQNIALKNLKKSPTTTKPPVPKKSPATLLENFKVANTALDFKGYIEYKPNGTFILRDSRLDNATNAENLLLFKSVLKALKLVKPFQGNLEINSTSDPAEVISKLQIKIYGDGVEHRFPPFLERIIQRIQTYFSVYKHADTSRPVSEAVVPVTTGVTTYATTTSYGGSTSVQSNLLFDTPYAHTTQKIHSTPHVSTTSGSTFTTSFATSSTSSSSSPPATTSTSSTTTTSAEAGQLSSTTQISTTDLSHSSFDTTSSNFDSSTLLTIDDDYADNNDYISVGED